MCMLLLRLLYIATFSTYYTLLTLLLFVYYLTFILDFSYNFVPLLGIKREMILWCSIYFLF